MNLGPTELIIIGIVVLLLFGASRMPKMARSLGQSMRILKAETKGLRNDSDESEVKAEPAAPAKPQQLQANGQPQPQPQVAPPIEQTQANKNVS